jgi:hypothetical protein
VLSRLVEDVVKSKHMTVRKVFADGAYHSNEIFKCLTDKVIMPCIKVRSNTRLRKLPIISLEIYQSYISEEKQFTKLDRHRKLLWKKEMDCRNSIFIYKKNVCWRICYSVKFNNMRQEMIIIKASL